MIDIEFLKRIAQEAGKIAFSYFGKVKAMEKEDKSPVTEADLEVDKFIRKKIKENYPHNIILSEELEKEGEGEGNPVWIIDPIDGTASFASGLPVWGISIGVLVDYFPLYGAFYMPVTNELYYSDGNFSYLWNKKIRTKDAEITSNSFFAVPSDCHRRLDMRAFIGKTRSMGSIAAHLCYIARGIAVGGVMKPHIWDIGAGSAILRSAGGDMKYLDGTIINFKELCSGQKAKKWCIAGEKNQVNNFSCFINEIPCL